MNKADIELIRDGLEAGDPEELRHLMIMYCIDAIRHMSKAYRRGKDMLNSRNPTEEDMKFVRENFNKAADALLDAMTMFKPDCMLDLLNCED